MPTYQYRCTECGHDLEAVQKFSDSALTECPRCSGQLRKVFNAVGVVFKGSGFYRNDSRPKEGAGVNGPSKDSNGDHRADDKAEKKPSTTGSGSDSGANGTGGATKKEPAASSSSKGSSGSSGTASSTGSSSSS